MKKHHHLFIFVFIFLIVAILFLMIKDDLISSLNNLVASYKDSNIKEESISVGLEEESYDPIVNIDLPGALRVSSDTESNKEENDTLSINRVITYTNEERKVNGELPPLKENKILNESAKQKLEDMFDEQYFDHISPDRKNMSNLAEENSYEYILIGENLAMGNFKDNEALVDAWMASSGHRANILNKNYTEIGVAVGQGQFEGRNVWMAVQHFGTPKSVCPSIDNALYGIILINKGKIGDMSGDLEKRQENIKNGAIYRGMSFYEQITSYNKLVSDYNNLISETKEKIEEYNKQVQIFNSCLYGFK